MRRILVLVLALAGAALLPSAASAAAMPDAATISDARADAQSRVNAGKGPNWVFYAMTFSNDNRSAKLDFFRDAKRKGVRYHRPVRVRFSGDDHRVTNVGKARRYCNLRAPKKSKKRAGRVDHGLCAFSLPR